MWRVIAKVHKAGGSCRVIGGASAGFAAFGNLLPHDDDVDLFVVGMDTQQVVAALADQSPRAGRAKFHGRVWNNIHLRLPSARWGVDLVTAENYFTYGGDDAREPLVALFQEEPPAYLGVQGLLFPVAANDAEARRLCFKGYDPLKERPPLYGPRDDAGLYLFAGRRAVAVNDGAVIAAAMIGRPGDGEQLHIIAAADEGYAINIALDKGFDPDTCVWVSTSDPA